MQVLVILLHLTLVVVIWYVLAHQVKHDMEVATLVSNDTYMGLLSNIKDGASSLLPINLSALGFARVLNSSLNGTLPSFSIIEDQVIIFKKCKYASFYIVIANCVESLFFSFSFCDFSGGSQSVFSIFHCTTPISEFLYWGEWSSLRLLQGKKPVFCNIRQFLRYFIQFKT